MVLLVVAAIAGAVGVGWMLLDAVETEWDYCARGGCIAGWLVGAGFTVARAAAAVVGLELVRGDRRGSGSGDRVP